jgi:hypothetical protein
LDANIDSKWQFQINGAWQFFKSRPVSVKKALNEVYRFIDGLNGRAKFGFLEQNQS